MRVSLKRVWLSFLTCLSMVPSAGAQYIDGNKLYAYCTVLPAAPTYYQDFATCAGYVLGDALRAPGYSPSGRRAAGGIRPFASLSG